MSSLFVIGIFVVLLVAIIGAFITQWVKLDQKNDRDKRMAGASENALAAENKALREQLDQVYDRLETLERIVTDNPSRLAEEIDRLETLPPRPERPADKK